MVIELSRLVIVLRQGEPHFFLYPTKLFTETQTRWQEKAMIQANFVTDPWNKVLQANWLQMPLRIQSQILVQIQK